MKPLMGIFIIVQNPMFKHDFIIVIRYLTNSIFDTFDGHYNIFLSTVRNGSNSKEPS